MTFFLRNVTYSYLEFLVISTLVFIIFQELKLQVPTVTRDCENGDKSKSILNEGRKYPKVGQNDQIHFDFDRKMCLLGEAPKFVFYMSLKPFEVSPKTFL